MLRITLYKIFTYSLIIFLTTGCVRYESLVSFNNEEEVMPTSINIDNFEDLKIQNNDVLKIEISSFNMEAAAPFNLSGGNTNNQQMMRGNTDNLELFLGYLVDAKGMVDLPVLGAVELAGLTVSEAKTKVRKLVEPYLKDAVINMRFINFKVTILGEVNMPGIVSLTNNRVTLLEAIGRAGDLTNYANRNNILVIREEDGVRTYNRVDLQSYNIFESPYFYLQQNDMIYVEPLQARVATVEDPARRFISYGSGILSVITLIIALTR